MPEEPLNTGEEEDLAAGDQDLEDTGGEPADKGGEPETVPLSALKEERKKRQDLEEQVRQSQETLAVYQANMRQAQTQLPQQKEVARRLLDTLDDNEVVTARELKQIVKETTEQFDANVMAPMGELQMMTLYPDYIEVLQKNLPTLLKSNPALISAIRSSNNPNLLAYTLAGGKGTARKTKEVKEGEGDDGKGGGKLKKILSNIGKPGVPGKGAGAGGKFEKFANMKDEDLEDHIARVKSG